MTLGSPSFCKSCTNYFLSPNINGAIATEVVVGPVCAKLCFKITFQFQKNNLTYQNEIVQITFDDLFYENNNILFEYRTLSVMSSPTRLSLPPRNLFLLKTQLSGKFYLATRRKFLSFIILSLDILRVYWTTPPPRWLRSGKGSKTPFETHCTPVYGSAPLR